MLLAEVFMSSITKKLIVTLFVFFSAQLSWAGGVKQQKEIYYKAANQAITFRGDMPDLESAAPKRHSWQSDKLSNRHLEEILGLLRAALSSHYPRRESEYTLAVAGGGVRIKAPDDIRETASRYMGALMTSRRKELVLNIEHFQIDHATARTLDKTEGAVIPDKIYEKIIQQAREQSQSVELLGSLTGTGTSRLSANHTRDVKAAYLHHAKVLPTVVYKTFQKGGWFSAVINPAGPARWQLNLSLFMAWDITTTDQQSDVYYPVGDQAIKGRANLALPRWKSLAYKGNLLLQAGQPVLLSLSGADAPGRSFEAVIVRLSDPLYSTKKGPVAITFDGSGVLPAQVLEKMRELSSNKEVKAWGSGTLLLLEDIKLRGLCLKAVEELMPSNTPQRLRFLSGEDVKVNAPVEISNDKVEQAAERMWQSSKTALVSITVSSGSGAARLNIEKGSYKDGLHGLGHSAQIHKTSFTAGCTGPGKRRILAIRGAFENLQIENPANHSESVEFQRMLEKDTGFIMPSRDGKGAILLFQNGKTVEKEGYVTGSNNWGEQLRD